MRVERICRDVRGADWRGYTVGTWGLLAVRGAFGGVCGGREAASVRWGLWGYNYESRAWCCLFWVKGLSVGECDGYR